jgi:hypothetical protein
MSSNQSIFLATTSATPFWDHLVTLHICKIISTLDQFMQSDSNRGNGFNESMITVVATNSSTISFIRSISGGPDQPFFSAGRTYSITSMAQHFFKPLVE